MEVVLVYVCVCESYVCESCGCACVCYTSFMLLRMYVIHQSCLPVRVQDPENRTAHVPHRQSVCCVCMCVCVSQMLLIPS
jgi:hypothetical protein